MLDQFGGRQNEFSAMPRLINGKASNKFKDPYGTNLE
jgi:hypothetical protein